MAGAANCGKIRLTGRQQWFGQEDAPALQTVSFNTALDQDGISGFGMILFNDKMDITHKEEQNLLMRII